ncbi:hypothetical protein FRC09_019037 [Ceratobasidium sp. 395]|nr:hypothetical protein FRC09_019037 [Ceratobasidium sp. 395]
MQRKTLVYVGYFISKEELAQWSEREAQSSPVYRQCLKREAGSIAFALGLYLRKLKLGISIKCQFVPKLEHGGCGFHCWNMNLVFYRRYAEARTLATCKPAEWKRFAEKATDLEVKQKLEDALNIELSEWTIIVWAPTAMLYNVAPEEFEERKAEFMEQIENGPPGPCGGDPPPLP